MPISDNYLKNIILHHILIENIIAYACSATSHPMSIYSCACCFRVYKHILDYLCLKPVTLCLSICYKPHLRFISCRESEKNDIYFLLFLRGN